MNILGETKKALADLNTSQALNPNNYHSLFGLASYHIRLGEKETAKDYLNRLIALDFPFDIEFVYDYLVNEKIPIKLSQNLELRETLHQYDHQSPSLW